MPKLRLYLFVLLVILSLSAIAEKYYWVGGAGSWSEISHWATSSGGNAFMPAWHCITFHSHRSACSATTHFKFRATRQRALA